jgi:hypothetical protein
MNRITKLNSNEIFVFGSNLAGIHGKGAAKDALKFGAIYGKGEGLYGQTYAIPTKDRNIKTLSLCKIKIHIIKFIRFTKEHTNLIFIVTPIGCGLAGYNPNQIAPMFTECLILTNIILPDEFKNVLNRN